MDLEVDVQRSGRGRHEAGRPGRARIGNVEDAEAAVAALPDVRVLVADHDLDAMRAPALIGVAQQPQTADGHNGLIVAGTARHKLVWESKVCGLSTTRESLFDAGGAPSYTSRAKWVALD